MMMREELEQVKTAFAADYERATTPQEVEALRVKYLGRKSQLNKLFSHIPALSRDEKALWGRKINELKQDITARIEEKLSGKKRGQEQIDLTFPPSPLRKGSIHVLSSVTEKICSIFKQLGFTVIEGGEVEDEWHNFSALNIPLEHPSRDAFDTFYLNLSPAGGRKKSGRYLLRSHTSPSQIRVMQERKPPLAVISPGRVYRPDAVDASHSFMFHQIEGFAVSKEINFSHLKGVLHYFAQSFFSPRVRLRFRPHFFPFTEPSAEVDVSCMMCEDARNQPASSLRGGRGLARPSAEPRAFGGKPETREKGKTKKAGVRTQGLQSALHTTDEEGRKCSVCKGKGWLEILGCGMIHPAVLECCGIDSRVWRGFAFGMGVDRIAMLKYHINDIRLFYENDIRFLEQFLI